MRAIQVEVRALEVENSHAVLLVDGEDYANECIDLIAAALSAVPGPAVLLSGRRNGQRVWIGPAEDYPEGFIDVDSYAISFDELLGYEALELVLSQANGWRCAVTLTDDVVLEDWDRLPQVVSRTGLWDSEVDSKIIEAALTYSRLADSSVDPQDLRDAIPPGLYIPAVEYLASLPEEPDTAQDAEVQMKLAFALQLGGVAAERIGDVPAKVSHATLNSFYLVADYLTSQPGTLNVLDDGAIDPDAVVAILTFDQCSDQLVTSAAPQSVQACMEEFDSFIADIEAMWGLGYLERSGCLLVLSDAAKKLLAEGQGHGLGELVFVGGLLAES